MAKATRVVAALIMTAAMLSGCSSNVDKGATPSNEKPKEGGTLKVGLVKIADLDPAIATTISERVLVSALFEPLTTWDPKTLGVSQALSHRWESSPDRKQWTFHLREGVVAGNGEPVTANDVKWTFERIAVPGLNSPAREMLWPIVGFDAVSKGEKQTLDGVVAVDPLTVRFDLTTATADFPRLVGNPGFGIVHPVAAGGTSTTGHYKILNKSDDAMELTKSGDGSHLDKVDVKFYPSAEASYQALETDALDWAPIPPERAEEAGKKYGPHLFKESLRSLYISFNLSQPVFGDVRIREAIVHAIDRAAVARLLSPSANVINGVVMDAVPGSQGGGCGSACTYDVERSKRLIHDVVGDAPIPPITMDTIATAPFAEPAVQKIVSDLQAVGITVNPKSTPADAFSNVTVNPDRQLFQTSWSAAFPSPEAFLVPLFRSDMKSNVSGLKSPTVDQLLTQAQGEVDQGVRNNLWQQAEREIMSQMPVIPIAQFPVDSIASDRVRGLSVLPTGNFNFTSVWVD